MYLLFDTETTGLPRSWNAKMEDVNNWPRLVQIAWLEYDEDGKEISKGDYIIKPEGYVIPKEAARIHKIDTELACSVGDKMRDVLNVLSALISKSKFLVAHNINFDINVVGAEFIREYIKSDMLEKKQICTMNAGVDLCKIPGKTKYKFPKLSELYRKLFDEGFSEAHNAAADIEATGRCFWEMKRLGLFDEERKDDGGGNSKSDGGEKELSLF